ncbi:DUF1439 domain-containing protein [Vibrio mediterranei]|uniref:DUF1439 domain-containing protein n=1 Tax=Vibrio mediterranei TaxID=689 RepID=A0AAN1FD55_9VIBR|nr:DUF1439 domain-containing protein [Vibrio mediterranei]ASI88390.1 hypothetical protein BSZ05_00385 [Vibrio mediterranei]
MKNRFAKLLWASSVLLLLSGCVSYSITEQEMTNYLNHNLQLNQSVGVENVMYAKLSVDDLQVKIGRSDADRVAVFANTKAQLQLLDEQDINLDLDIEFSAIPKYEQESGEIFLQSLRLEKIDQEGQLLTPEIKKLIKPAVSMIGAAMSTYPVYKLDSNTVKEALLKSSNPEVVVKNNQLVIEFFE